MDERQTIERTRLSYLKMPSLRHTLRLVLVITLTAIITIGGWVGWKVYASASRITGNKNPLSLVSAFSPVDLKEVNGRTNILLAGYSKDDPGHSGAELTDSIMILSMNQSTKSAVVISVPRDLYVNVPSYGYSKINAAYEYGESDNFSEAGYANGGMGLLEKTIKQTLGVDISYYGLINYTAFKSAVDAVGGITITISSSNPRGIYDSNTGIKFANGSVTLDGQTALNLARSRGDSYYSYGFPNSDFDRTKYQQAMLLALKGKASNASVIANPLKIGELADSVGDNVKTNMQINEMETLYSVMKDVNDNNIETITLNNIEGTNLLIDYRTLNGQSALIPALGLNNFSAIDNAIDNLLAPKTQ